jgi:hypothetical protein
VRVPAGRLVHGQQVLVFKDDARNLFHAPMKSFFGAGMNLKSAERVCGLAERSIYAASTWHCKCVLKRAEARAPEHKSLKAVF